MKLIYHYRVAQIAVGLLGLVANAFGQAEGDAGNFRFADATGLSEKISLMVDASKIKPAGFASGDFTGSIGILAGSHVFTVTSTEAGVAAATIPLSANASTTVIAYCKVVMDRKTNTLRKSIQLLPRPNPPKNSGRHFQVLYVSNRPDVDIVLNGAPARVKAMKEVNGPELPGGNISVARAGASIVQFTAPQAGNFLVVLYDSSAGSLAGFVIPNYN